MPEFDNTNRGSIWKNEKKEKATQADFTGTINVEGVEYWLNGWRRKEGASAKAPAMSFTVRRKGAVPAAQYDGEKVTPRSSTQTTYAAKASSRDMDDEIPF